MWNGDSFYYNDSVFPVWYHGSVSRIAPRYGIFGGADGTVRNRNRRYENFVDL